MRYCFVVTLLFRDFSTMSFIRNAPTRESVRVGSTSGETTTEVRQCHPLDLAWHRLGLEGIAKLVGWRPGDP